jgi:5-methylcytosine-specific restriction endonuclease McrA
VRFDLQQLENPEISGIEYQQGTLLGYEVREYLLDAWDRKCAYCGIKDTPLQVEHIHPKAKGGHESYLESMFGLRFLQQKERYSRN